jgi:hypothetical protein
VEDGAGAIIFGCTERLKASLAEKSAKVFLTPRPEGKEFYKPFMLGN